MSSNYSNIISLKNESKNPIFIADTLNDTKVIIKQNSYEKKVYKIIKSHSTILSLLDSFIDNSDNKLYCVYEYAPLGDILSYKFKNETELAACIRSVLFGLYHCHQSGILHCDIKPDNILNFGNNIFKLSDFDCSIISSYDLTFHEDLCFEFKLSSLSYMAPENFSNKVCAKSDVWALGITMYGLITGHYPYPDYSNLLFKHWIKNNIRYKIKTPISPEALSFINCCLEYDINKRFSVSELLEHPFIQK